MQQTGGRRVQLAVLVSQAFRARQRGVRGERGEDTKREQAGSAGTNR